jgi:hypothetical protein
LGIKECYSTFGSSASLVVRSREQGAREMFYFLNLYSYREYSRKKTIVFNSFNSLNSFNSNRLSECETEINSKRQKQNI